MNYKTKFLGTIYFTLFLTLSLLVVYLLRFETRDEEQLIKLEQFVEVASLPDLAITTEAMSIRHRSLADTFSLFKESPELNEYFPTTFIYNYSDFHKVQK